MRAILIALALVACADPAPIVHTCAVFYRCTDAEYVHARFALPCATDEDAAADQAIDLWLAQGANACGDHGWAYVRAECEAYEPKTVCP